ncbi:uncharacterized protein JCM10292_002866 [Rhodotorula paludigena]|uniref:uncharacterized protein n=1 Tax=Rhodotorula paludigena TaxID=86838 RepID=UPI00317D5B46
MPLLFPSDPQDPQALLNRAKSASGPHFLVFFSSLDESTGKPWCPDCSDVQASVDEIVPQDKSTLVFVGSREEWRDPNNKFRQPPFKVDRIPTIIRVEGGEANVASSLDSAPRLIESELRDPSKLKQFVA